MIFRNCEFYAILQFHQIFKLNICSLVTSLVIKSFRRPAVFHMVHDDLYTI